jgi:hypothetical protein
MRAPYAGRKVDRGSVELIELLRASGIDYEPLGAAIDGVAWFRGRVALIDFKANGKAPKTPKQSKLIARDCPICFIFDAAGVRVVVDFLKRGEA